MSIESFTEEKRQTDIVEIRYTKLANRTHCHYQLSRLTCDCFPFSCAGYPRFAASNLSLLKTGNELLCECVKPITTKQCMTRSFRADYSLSALCASSRFIFPAFN